MNREILFRGKRVDNGEWVYGNLVSGICVYVLTNFDTTLAEDYERVKRLQEVGLTPDVRIYRKNTAPQITKDLARWCNNRYIYRSCPDLMDYVPRADGKTFKELYREEI